MNDISHLSFSQWLRQKRKSRDFTQDELADRIGCSIETIRKIEAGRRRPSRQMAELLAVTLGAPSEDVLRLVEMARTSDDAESMFGEIPSPNPLDGREPRARVPKRPNVHLPAQRTTFIGRQREVERVLDLLMQADVRLVTLTGPPGIGKTRLSLQVAASMGNYVEDGVYLVALSPLSDPNMLPSAIARSLGVKEVPNQSVIETLEEYLSNKEMLLVLDNFEHIVPAGPLVTDLITACPELKVLVTSRTALHLYGEYQVAVPPLAMPDSDPPRWEKAEEGEARVGPKAEELAQYEAVALFVQRARTVIPNFDINESNAATIAEICRQLDGLPLAIELAAARIKLLSPAAILERLTSRLNLLTSGSLDLPPRQRTLRGAIDWSYGLLDQPDMMLFRRMSVFVGSAALDSIDKVCKLPSEAGFDTLTQVDSLLDKSLVLRADDTVGESRFWMLWTIREYALGKLAESGEEATIRHQHAAYCLEFAERAASKLLGPESAEWSNLLESEIGNLRAALNWCCSAGAGKDDHETGLRLAGTLHWFWYLRGYLTEGRTWLEKALAHSSPEERTLARAVALDAAGRLALLQDDYSQLLPRLEESVDILRQLGEHRALAYALTNLGIARVYQNRDAGNSGYELIEEATRLFRVVGDNWGLAFALDIKADATVLLGGTEEVAARYREESLALYRGLGDDRGIATELSELGYSAVKLGNYELAQDRLEEAIALTRAVGDRWYTAVSLRNLGDVAMHQEDYGQAAAYYRESLSLYRELGDKVRASNALRNLGHVYRHLEKHAEAAQLYSGSLKLAGETDNLPNIALCISAMSSIALAAQNPTSATRLLGMSCALRERSHGLMPPLDLAEYTRSLEMARCALEASVFASAWDEGMALSIEEALEEACAYEGSAFVD